MHLAHEYGKLMNGRRGLVYIIKMPGLLGVSHGTVLGCGVAGTAGGIKFWAASATSLMNEAFSAVSMLRISKCTDLLICLLSIVYSVIVPFCK